MLPPSLACLTCNPCTTSALFEYFGCGLTPTSLTPLTCKPCTTSALFEYFGCGLTPYAARKKSKVDINVPFAFFPFCAWLTGKQKNSAPRREAEKRCLL